MFEKFLAIRYLKAQKRHSFFTVSSIALALALITMLFVGYATYTGILRDSAYLDKPYHFKMLKLTEDEYQKLANNPEFLSCTRTEEPDGTLSAAILVRTYHEDFGLFVNDLFPEKYVYSDLEEEFKPELVDVNYSLVTYDRLDLPSRYEAVRRLAIFFIFILFLVIALRLMIDTAFEISSKERERQYGMLQCMGAAPGQIVRMIAFEGLFLSILGIPLGIVLGLGLSAVVFQAVQVSGIAEAFFSAEKIPQLMHLHINPVLLGLGAVTGLVWVFLSAYQTGMRVIKMSPIQAISGRSNQVVKVQQFFKFNEEFWKVKLAVRNTRRQPKRFIITVISLTLSIALFASFSIVLNKSLASFEKAVQLLGLDYDMSIAVQIDPDDPLSYQAGLENVRNSGYFEIEDFSKMQLAYITMQDETVFNCLILYYPQEIFNQQFEGTVPVSYEELTQQNAYLMMIQDGDTTTKAERFESLQELPLLVQSRSLVTEEEYTKMTPKEQEQVRDFTKEDYQTGEKTLKYRFISEEKPSEIQIAGAAPERKKDEESKLLTKYQANGNLVILVGTLDTYEAGAWQMAGKGSLINEEGADYIHVNLKDEDDYEIAKAYVNGQSGLLSLYEDFYGDLIKMKTVVGAIQIGSAFLSVLIGVIALVNMINILSTGILNRRAEFAAMQCLGLTEGQLYGMMVIECLQYALAAGILATLLLEALTGMVLLYLKSVQLEEVFGDMLSFTEPLPKVWLAAAASFAAAICAALFPLRRMQKESLTDRMRNND